MMKTRTGMLLVALAGLLALLLLPACGEEKVLTLQYWQAATLPSSYLASGYKDTDAAALTLEPLANYDPSGNLTPRLAVEIPTVENGGVAADLTSITWSLHDDVKWSDGSDLTAQDVVFTWRYCTDEETGCTAEDAFAGIRSVEAVDDRTVRIRFEGPTPYPYNAFVGAGAPVISEAQFRTVSARLHGTATNRTTHPLALARIASSSSSPTKASSTSATPTTGARNPTSTASSFSAAVTPSRRPALCWTRRRSTTGGTCRLRRRRWRRWRPWVEAQWLRPSRARPSGLC